MNKEQNANERAMVMDLAQHWPPVQFRAVMFWMGRAHGAEIRADEAEEEALEQARLNGMGSEREASLIAQLEVAQREAWKWKANHDNQAELHRAIKDRPDLGDRCRSVLALINERDELRAKVVRLQTVIDEIEAEK